MSHLTSLLCCLIICISYTHAFYDLFVDEYSNELVKPTNWSDARFNLVKMIRLRELLQEAMTGVEKDPLLFPDEPSENLKTRSKRSVDVSKIGSETAPNIAQGLYKQERLMLPKLSSYPALLDPAEQQSLDLYSGVYEGTETTNLLFKVGRQNGNIQVLSVTHDGTAFGYSPLVSSFDVSLDGGEITDVVLGKDPEYGVHYLAVVVNKSLDWPNTVEDLDGDNDIKDEIEFMKVNIPIEMPEGGRTRIYSFELTGNRFKSELKMVVPTIEAVDAEFWVENESLYLAVAHRGNYTTNTENTESVLLKHNYLSSSKFEIIQGYRGIDSGDKDQNQIVTDLSFVTHNPKSVVQFNINGRSFLVFADNDSKNQTGSVNTFSPIFSLNLNSGKYEMVQRISTFSAVDVTFFQIVDPVNPLNSQFFLIFANNADDSFVFKFTEGKFLPFQGLSVQEPISVTTFMKTTTTEYESSTVDVLEHYIVFLTSSKQLVFYQYDGTRFNLPHPSLFVNDDLVLTEAEEVDTIILANIPTLLIRTKTNAVLCSVNFNYATVFNRIFASSQSIRSYVDHWTNIDNRPNFPELKKMLGSAPQQDQTKISVKDVEFANSFTAVNIIIDPSLITSQVPGESELKVAGKTTINAALIDELEKYVTSDLKSISKLKTTLDSLKSNLNLGAKLDKANVLKQNVHFNEIQVNVALTTADTDIDVNGAVVKYEIEDTVNGGNILKSIDLVDYMLKAIELPDDDSSRIYLPDVVRFAKLRFESSYSINNLNGVFPRNYYKLGSSRNIGGTIKFKAGAVFKASVDVEGTVDGVTVSSSELILKKGAQTIDTPVRQTSGNLQLTELKTEQINGFSLSILNKALMAGDSTFVVSDMLTVNDLVINGTVETTEQFGVLDSVSLEKISTVNLEDLVIKSMKKSKDNTIALKYKFENDVTVAGDVSIIDASQLNYLNFPTDFVSISDPDAIINHPGTLFLPEDTVFDYVEDSSTETNVKLKVAEQISTNAWTLVNNAFSSSASIQDVGVDSDGNLDLLLLTPTTTLPNYKHTVSHKKFFKTIQFNENVALSGTVLGYELAQVKLDNADGSKTYSDNLEVANLVLQGGSQTITSLVLDNDILDVGCIVGVDVQCTDSINFATIYNTGVSLSAVEIPTAIKSISFRKQATFKQNLDVTSLKTLCLECLECQECLQCLECQDKSVSYVPVNPETDFLKTSGTGNFVFSKPMVFVDHVTSGENILQSEGAKVKVCELGFNGQCLCNDCSNANCEMKSQTCLVKSGVTDSSLYTSTISHQLSFVNYNALKINTDQIITPRLIFKGGFEAENLEVTTEDCTINTIACSRIASATTSQTFTGTNNIYGSINTGNTVKVNTALSVSGTVDQANTAVVYTDSVFMDMAGGAKQVVEGRKTISKNFALNQFTTNNVHLDSINVNPVNLYSDNYVKRNEDSAIIVGNLEFAETPTLNLFTASNTVTWDGVTLDNFYNNLWRNGVAQTIRGDVVVNGNSNFDGGLTTSNTNSDGVKLGFINNVEIIDMESRALRISGNNVPVGKKTLGDASFKEIESTASDGIRLSGLFMGVDLANNAIKNKDNGVLNFKETQTFSTAPTLKFNLELDGNIVPINNAEPSINQNELWNFLKNAASVTKIKVTSSSGASITNEPTITSVNSNILNTLRTEKWYKKDNVDIAYPVTFADAQFTGKLFATHLDGVELTKWRDYHLSLSKDQIITQDYTFDTVSFNLPVSVAKVFIGTSDGEGNLITESKTHKFVDHYFKVLFKNMTYSDVTPVLKPYTADISANVLMTDLTNAKATINALDISQDVLTYKVGDTKTFSSKVAIVGDLVVKSTGDLSLKDDTVHFYQTASDAAYNLGIDKLGVTQEDNDYKVLLSKCYPNTVKTTDSITDEIDISGKISFMAQPTFNDLALDSTFNAIDIGSCDSPKILTTNNCGSSGEQTVPGSLIFGSQNKNVDVTFKVMAGDLTTVNAVNWQGLMSKMISKTKPVSVTFTAPKTFSKTLVFKDDGTVTATFSSKVFGVDLRTVVSSFSGSTDMTYASDQGEPPVMPDLIQAVAKISQQASLLPNEFLYMQPILAELGEDMRVRTMGMLNLKNVAEDVWDKAPFHLASLSGNVANEVVTLKLNKITYLGGVARNTLVSHNTPTFTIGNDGVLGDMELIYDDVTDEYYYFLSTRSKDLIAYKEDLSNTKLVTSGKYYNYFFVWNGELTLRQFSEEDIMDLEPIQWTNEGTTKNCIVSCGLTSQVYCLTRAANDEAEKKYKSYLSIQISLSSSDNCFKASTTPNAVGDDMLALVRGKETVTGGVDIYKNVPGNSYVLAQTIPCYLCSYGALGSFDDKQLGKHRIFVTIVSNKADFIFVGEYTDATDATAEFEVYQKLNVSQPSEADFYTQKDSLYLSVLSGFQSEAKLLTFVLQGSMGFLPVDDWTISLPGVSSHEVLSSPYLKGLFVTTMGMPYTPSLITGLTANTVMQAVYKQSSVDAIRTEVESSQTPIPSFVSDKCRTMVTAYANKLYSQGSTTPENYGELLLRMLPRPYLQFTTELFTPEVQAVLNVPVANHVRDSNPPEAVVNFYRITSDDMTRDLTDSGYYGTAFVYQDLNGVLYVATRIKDTPYEQKSPNYRHITFLESCETGAAAISYSTFNDVKDPIYPVETANSDDLTQDLCMMVHDFGKADELKNIKGKAFVGAILVADSSGSKLACGLIKHPEQAMVQFLTDHNADIILFHPYGRNF